MKKKAKLFIIYFPVILVAGQVLVNLISFVLPSFYQATGFYLNTFLGTNVLYSVFLLDFTFMFQFCAVSRWAAIAEVLFGLNYLVVQQDNLYNILFQVVVGVIAMLLTFRHYVKKFPLCRLSLLMGFISSVASKGSCQKGYEKWERNLKNTVSKHYHEGKL